MSDSSLESPVSDALLCHKAGSQEVLTPLPRTDMQIQLLFCTQPLTKDEERRKQKRRKSSLLSLQFHSVTLLPFTQISIQFLLWWQSPSHSCKCTGFKKSLFLKMVTKIISLGEALRNNSNPHNFKRKQTQMFAKLSLHSLLPER